MFTLAKYRMNPYLPSQDVGNMLGKSVLNGYVYTPVGILSEPEKYTELQKSF